jgi:hypothetical protein
VVAAVQEHLLYLLLQVLTLLAVKVGRGYAQLLQASEFFMLAVVVVVVLPLMAVKAAQVVVAQVRFILEVVLMQLREQQILAEAGAVLLMVLVL